MVISQAEAKQIGRRAGLSPEQMENALRGLPDPIDTERDQATLAERGLTVSILMDRMGGSP